MIKPLNPSPYPIRLADLVELMHDQIKRADPDAKITKEQTRTAVALLVERVTQAIGDGHGVSFLNRFRILVDVLPARKVKLPGQDEATEIPPRPRVRFSPSARLTRSLERTLARHRRSRGEKIGMEQS